MRSVRRQAPLEPQRVAARLRRVDEAIVHHARGIDVTTALAAGIAVNVAAPA
jgi:hypothetical protein